MILTKESLLDWAAMIQKHIEGAKVMAKLTGWEWDDWAVDVADRLTEHPDKVEAVLDWLQGWGIVGAGIDAIIDKELPNEFKSIQESMNKFGEAVEMPVPNVTQGGVIGLVGILVLGYVANTLGTRALDIWEKEGPAPVVIPVSTWENELTEELRAEKNPTRITQLRNMWAGLAHSLPPEKLNVLAIERVNQLAGEIAVSGLGPRNEAASNIIQQEFKNVLKSVTDPLDEAETDKFKAFFQAIADCAEKAL